MKMQRVLTGIVLACGMAGTVQAAILASGPVFGAGQNHVACQVFNAGSTSIDFISTQMFSQQGADALPLSFNNCLPALAPGDVCTFQAPATAQAYSCKVVIVQAKANVRGTMAALSSTNVVVSEADLR